MKCEDRLRRALSGGYPMNNGTESGKESQRGLPVVGPKCPPPRRAESNHYQLGLRRPHTRHWRALAALVGVVVSNESR